MPDITVLSVVALIIPQQSPVAEPPRLLHRPTCRQSAYCRGVNSVGYRVLGHGVHTDRPLGVYDFLLSSLLISFRCLKIQQTLSVVIVVFICLYVVVIPPRGNVLPSCDGNKINYLYKIEVSVKQFAYGIRRSVRMHFI